MAHDEVLSRAAEANEQFRPIELTAETVTRPAGSHTPTVHSFLRHLRAKGLDGVPEPVSLDGEIETLKFIEGDSGGDGWKHQHDEQGLRSAARLLRLIHDASVDWVPPDDAVFAAPAAEDSEVFVNGDPGPWNFVWRDGEAVALIDWDFLHRASRLSDVAYALQWFAPVRDDQAAIEWHHFPEVPNRRARIEAFLDAYGIAADFDVADAVIQRIQYTSEHVRFLAAQGQEPQKTWVAEGSVEREKLADIAWIEENRSLFSRSPRKRSSRGARRMPIDLRGPQSMTHWHILPMEVFDMATRNVVLSHHQHELVEGLVKSGRYQNASEVLREGLRLLEREEAEETAKIAVLRQAAEQGWSDLASGRFDDVDDTSLDKFVAQLGVRAARTPSEG